MLLPLLIAASACEQESAVEKVLRPVSTIEVGFADGGTARTFSGSAQTDKIVNLSFRTAGIVTNLNVKLGQRVRKGQLLARLDNVQARLAYEQALSSLNSAESQMNTAKLGLDRVRTLYEKGSASLSDYESAKNSFRTSEAGYQSASRSVEIQQEQMSYGFIYAPESGTIAAVSVELDENVGAGQAIAVLNVGTNMEVSLGLPENVINRVNEGATVQITFPSLSDETHRGLVSEVSPSVDPKTATYPVRVAITDPSENIKSGMTSNVTFDFGGTGDTSTLVIPAKAVGEDSDGRFVFLLSEGGSSTATVSKKRIEVGELTSAGFEVTDGLLAGQRIATAGLQTLLDGQEVRIK
ncbi:MAG: efflux RND transporter periplasmic adaptor subunit [Rhodothermales bacterium]|nr:efflux RND transporter periplasmic adaptor subunit [Rhodothermales bacterium]